MFLQSVIIFVMIKVFDFNKFLNTNIRKKNIKFDEILIIIFPTVPRVTFSKWQEASKKQKWITTCQALFHIP